MKPFAITSLIAITLLLAACNDDATYTPAGKETTQQVYFPDYSNSTIDLAEDSSSFIVTILRYNTASPLSFNLLISGDTARVNIPSTITFDAGQDTYSLAITYNAADFDYDDYDTITLAIPDEYTTLYGMASYTFSVGIPSAWNYLGYGTYTDDFCSTFFGITQEAYDVEIEENAVRPGLYRLINPYGEAFPWNDPGDYDTSQTYYLQVDAQDPDGVVITQQRTGHDWGYGMFIVWSEADRYIQQGGTLDEAKALGLCGTRIDGNITFPIDALLVAMEDYNNATFYTANTNAWFLITLPQ